MNFDKESEVMKDRYYNMYSYDGTNIYSGYDSYMQIFRRLTIPFYPFYLLMKLKIVRKIGERYYRKVADSRSCKI